MSDTPSLRMLDPTRQAVAAPSSGVTPVRPRPATDLHDAARRRAQALRREAMNAAGDRVAAALRRAFHATAARLGASSAGPAHTGRARVHAG